MTATDDSIPTTGGARSRLGLVLLACCVGQFMVVLDASIVNVALRPIQDSLHFSASTLQWVINAYTIVFAGFLLLGGRLADLFGRRRVFALGLALFTLASLVAGLAWSPSSLLIARGIQGLGGAVLAPATLTVLFTSFTDPGGKARAFGTWSAVAAAGGAIGALVGGVVTEWLSWRWIFLVNVPIGVALIALVLSVVPESRDERADRRIDMIGAMAVTAGLMAVVLGIVESQDKGWDSAVTIVSLVVGVLLVAFFLVNEAKFARQPLVPLSIFRNRSVSAANVVNFTTSAALVGVLFLFTLLMQFVYGFDALKTGLAYLPLSLAIVVTARGLAPQLITRLGPKPVLVTGSALSLVALIWLSFVSTDGGFVHDLLGPSILFGAGQGFVSATVTMAGTANVPYTQAGLVSGLLNASRQVGGALWLSVLAAVVAGHAGSLSAGASADGYQQAFLIATVFPLVGIIAGLAVPGVSPAELAAAKQSWGAKKPADSAQGEAAKS
ncbi:MFS transporter [Streptomyces sp. OR43]|uniref:MFS transporter n=1 Tax=Streptomyces sp. or43 TaxID=2478957 RepID=UPI0011CE2689|nr:MFS transporter [Streptomyces sp. or43]TXS39149.1 DHA2 family efflux MFS transporter permease subunit [Streptomyces sp. or43]